MKILLGIILAIMFTATAQAKSGILQQQKAEVDSIQSQAKPSPDELAKKYEEEARANPDSAEAWCKLGYAYLDLFEGPSAKKPFEQAIRLKPDYAEAYNGLGRSLYTRVSACGYVAPIPPETYEKALEFHLQAIYLKSDYADAYRSLGWDYFALKRYREAVIALQEARRIEPDNEYDIRLSGEACRELGWDEEAIKCFEELIQRYEKFSDVEKNKSYLFTSTLTNVAPLYAKAGRYHEALETYKLMLKLRPNLWTAHHGLGVTYLGLGDKESAMVEYEWLIKFAGDTEAKFVKQAAQKDADDLLSRIRK